MTQGCGFLLFVLLFFFSDVFSLTQRHGESPGAPGLHGALGCCPPLWCPSQGEPLWVRVALGGGLLQRWQQALLRQVSLQGVEDVELLIDAQGQELLDHLAGVGAPGRREKISHIHPLSKMNSKLTFY